MQCHVYVSGLNFICFDKKKFGMESYWHVSFSPFNHSSPFFSHLRGWEVRVLPGLDSPKDLGRPGGRWTDFPRCGQLSHQGASGWISRGLPLSRGVPCWGGPWIGWFAQRFSISCVAPMGWTGGTRVWPDSWFLCFKPTVCTTSIFSVSMWNLKKKKAVHTASSGNLSCWKMSVRSWLRSFGVCLNTSSRKIEHTHAHKYTWSFCHPGLASVCIRGYAGSPEARIESCLCHDQWQDGWSSRGLLSQPNGVKREGYFNHFQCPFPAKIWRERVFFLMAKPNFDLFQANSMVFWRKHCHHKVWVEHCSISRYKQVIYPR